MALPRLQESVVFPSPTTPFPFIKKLTDVVRDIIRRLNILTTTVDTLSTATDTSPIGKHEIPIVAEAMRPSATGGCDTLATIASAANQPDICYLGFDPATEEYAQFMLPMPKSWDRGTVTFRPIWSHPTNGIDTNYGVVWELQAVAISNDDAIATAYGTAQTSTDTGGTVDDVYIGPESSAITIAGTPASGDTVHFRIGRKIADAGDTFPRDARLHGIWLAITTDAATDA